MRHNSDGPSRRWRRPHGLEIQVPREKADSPCSWHRRSSHQRCSSRNPNRYSIHLDPAPLARRARHAVDDALDLEAFGKIDEAFAATGNAVEKMLRLDDL